MMRFRATCFNQAMGIPVRAGLCAFVCVLAHASPAFADEGEAAAAQEAGERPAKERGLRLSLGVAAGIGALDAGCDECDSVLSAGFGGQVGLRLGEPLFLGVGFVVATGSKGTTSDDLVFTEAGNDEVLFGLLGVARVWPVRSIFWGGGVGVASYTPTDRESHKGPLLMANAGYELVELEPKNALISLELQARVTFARVDGYEVMTGALLFGGMVMP